jgi:hypothetical protein
VSWVSDAPADYLFEIWGNPCFEVISAKVFQSYVNTGDWLVVCYYNNIYPPYYPSESVKLYFALQFNHDNVTMAQTACPMWEAGPGAIYMSATEVTPLEWGHGYRVRLSGTWSGAPYTEYELTSADWMGADLVRLDDYLLSIATQMEDYYGSNTVLTTYVQDKGQVLNTQGGVIFSNAIPYLTRIRPNLFTTAQVVPTYAEPSPTGGQALQQSHTMQSMLGPYVTAELGRMGIEFGGVDADVIGSIGVVLFYLLVAAFAFMAGQSGAAIFLAFPIFIAGALLGIIPMAVMFVALAIATFLLIYHFWWGRA